METVIAIGAALTGGGGAAAGAGAAGAGLGGLSTALAVAGTVTSVLAVNASVRASEEAALRAAEVETENARQARKAGQSTAQDADLEAAALLASIETQQGASGLLISSPSFQRRQNRNRIAAGVNRERIIEDSERQAKSADNRAESQRISAGNSRRERLFNVIAGGVQVGTDLVSGASLAARRRAGATDRNRVAI